MTRQDTLSCREVEELAGLYAVGALEPAEAEEVRNHLESHPDVHAQCLQVVAAASSLSSLAPPVEPPAELRQRVMQAVSSTEQVPSGPAPTQAPGWADARAPRAQAPRTDDPRRDAVGWRRGWTAPARALAFGTIAVLLAVVVGWGLLAQRGALAPDGQLALLRDAIVAQAGGEAQVVELVATEDGPRASGFVVLPPGEPGYIVLAGLPAVDANEVWQAWYLTDAEPASAGLLDVGPQGIASLEGLEPVPSTSGIALTLEPAGGSDAPTTTPVMIGTFVEA